MHVPLLFFIFLIDVLPKPSDPQASQGAGRLPGEGFRPDHTAQCQCRKPAHSKTHNTRVNVTAATLLVGKVQPQGNMDTLSSFVRRQSLSFESVFMVNSLRRQRLMVSPG